MKNADGRASINPRLDARAAPSSSVEALAEGLRAGDRAALSRAITLVESTHADHRAQAAALLDACRSSAEDAASVRIAVTGVPGVGKSTFLEALGTRLLGDDAGHRLAVLAIDPSSTRSKGSILGDKTRMARLARSERAFVRPSPTAGTLGGVARRTREAILLCEAAGYDTVFVETVGVGQAETEVHAMTDVFVLLALAGAGDQLQHVKRGVVEMADLIAVNKADGGNTQAAEKTRAAYESALRLLPASEDGRPGEAPRVLTCSAQTGAGLDDAWQAVQDFLDQAQASGRFQQKRQDQALRWMHRALEERLREAFFTDAAVQAALADAEADVAAGRLSPSAAAERLVRTFSARRNDGAKE